MEVFAGRYVLVDRIRDGVTGAVWRAWDVRRRSYCAAKLLLPSDAGPLLRFAREQSSRLEHPHVLAPTGWASDGDRVLLIMDLMRGGSLSDLLAGNRRFPLWFADALVEQLLSGLAVIHDRGIVHRNIKPSNLLLEPTGRGRPVLRLADFAVAAVADFAVAAVAGEPSSGPAEGSVAPAGDPGAEGDPRRDLYAAGVVAFHVVTGRAPGTVGRSGCPDGVPQAVWPLLRSLLDPSPSGRPRSAYAAMQAWQEAVASVGATHAHADGDPVEVVDRVGPLPDGFDADGPVGYARADEPAGPVGNLDPLTIGNLDPAFGPRTGATSSDEPGTTRSAATARRSSKAKVSVAVIAAAIVAVVLVGLGLVATRVFDANQVAVNEAAYPAPAAVGQGSMPASPSPLASGTPTGTPEPSATARPSSGPTNKPPSYVAASAFRPFGASYDSFPMTASGSLLTIGSPASYEHLWGAWLPGNSCTTSASFDIKLDAPVLPSPGYGYAVAPQSTMNNDQPVGWSLQHEWDADLNGFFTRPVLLPDGAWAGGDSTPASDVTAPHHVTVSANGTRYSVTIDGVSAGTFSGPATCGGLVLRVWGGATAHVDHIVTSH